MYKKRCHSLVQSTLINLTFYSIWKSGDLTLSFYPESFKSIGLKVSPGESNELRMTEWHLFLYTTFDRKGHLKIEGVKVVFFQFLSYMF